MTDATHVDSPTTIGKQGSITTLDGVKQQFKVIDEIRYPASNMPKDKVFYLQQLEWDTGHTGYRFCYYIKGKTDKWVFGRFAPLISSEDLRAIMEEAQARGWI